MQRCIKDNAANCSALQSHLATLYNWEEEVEMVFNGYKFEALRYWPGKTTQPYLPYLDPLGVPIEEKSHLRDLGVAMGNDCTFSAHIEKSVAAGNKLVGWAMRSIRRRSKHVMLTFW